MFWTSGDLEADQVMMPDQVGGGVSLTAYKATLHKKAPSVSRRRFEIFEVRST